MMNLKLRIPELTNVLLDKALFLTELFSTPSEVVTTKKARILFILLWPLWVICGLIFWFLVLVATLLVSPFICAYEGFVKIKKWVSEYE